MRIEGGGTIDGNADIDRWRGMSRPEGQRPMATFTVLSRDVNQAGKLARTVEQLRT